MRQTCHLEGSEFSATLWRTLAMRAACTSGILGGISFRFRAAAPADVETISDVYLASWRAGYQELLSPGTLEKQAALRGRYDWLEAIESPAAAVILGINGGHVVGVVEAREELPEAERDLPEITMLYVAPNLWGTRLATHLLAAGCSWIREGGHHVARLRVVEKQERARRFYEREGWTVDPDLPPTSNGLFRLLYYWRALGQGSPVKVRRRTATDLDACERLARIVHERDGYPPRRARDLRRFITSEPLAAWVAEDGPHIVGHVALHAEAPREVAALAAQATGRAPAGLVFLARLLVAPSHRRRGIGRELLDVATRAAHRRSRWPVLDVATTFYPAIQLYEAAGWTCAGGVTVEIPREPPLEQIVYLGPEPS